MDYLNNIKPELENPQLTERQHEEAMQASLREEPSRHDVNRTVDDIPNIRDKVL